MLFYFIFLFRFSSSFFSYLWDNYRTLLITVLFIRTDRLSCINIRVIIIVIKRPGGKLCWLATPLFCCCCWIWLGVNWKWNCRKNWKQENRMLFIEWFSAWKFSSKANDNHMIPYFCCNCSWLNYPRIQQISAVYFKGQLMGLERCLLNLWVKGESKRALKASFQEVEQLLIGCGASNSTSPK